MVTIPVATSMILDTNPTLETRGRGETASADKLVGLVDHGLDDVTNDAAEEEEEDEEEVEDEVEESGDERRSDPIAEPGVELGGRHLRGPPVADHLVADPLVAELPGSEFATEVEQNGRNALTEAAAAAASGRPDAGPASPSRPRGLAAPRERHGVREVVVVEEVEEVEEEDAAIDENGQIEIDRRIEDNGDVEEVEVVEAVEEHERRVQAEYGVVEQNGQIEIEEVDKVRTGGGGTRAELLSTADGGALSSPEASSTDGARRPGLTEGTATTIITTTTDIKHHHQDVTLRRCSHDQPQHLHNNHHQNKHQRQRRQPPSSRPRPASLCGFPEPPRRPELPTALHRISEPAGQAALEAAGRAARQAAGTRRPRSICLSGGAIAAVGREPVGDAACGTLDGDAGGGNGGDCPRGGGGSGGGVVGGRLRGAESGVAHPKRHRRSSSFTGELDAPDVLRRRDAGAGGAGGGAGGGGAAHKRRTRPMSLMAEPTGKPDAPAAAGADARREGADPWRFARRLMALSASFRRARAGGGSCRGRGEGGAGGGGGGDNDNVSICRSPGATERDRPNAHSTPLVDHRRRRDDGERHLLNGALHGGEHRQNQSNHQQQQQQQQAGEWKFVGLLRKSFSFRVKGSGAGGGGAGGRSRPHQGSPFGSPVLGRRMWTTTEPRAANGRSARNGLLPRQAAAAAAGSELNVPSSEASVTSSDPACTTPPSPPSPPSPPASSSSFLQRRFSRRSKDRQGRNRTWDGQDIEEALAASASHAAPHHDGRIRRLLSRIFVRKDGDASAFASDISASSSAAAQPSPSSSAAGEVVGGGRGVTVTPRGHADPGPADLARDGDAGALGDGFPSASRDVSPCPSSSAAHDGSGLDHATPSCLSSNSLCVGEGAPPPGEGRDPHTPTLGRRITKRRSNIFTRNSDVEKERRAAEGDCIGSGRAIPVKQGILLKWGGTLNKEWKKKYVTLCEGGLLTYYPSLHDYMQNVHGKDVALLGTTVKVPGVRPPRATSSTTTTTPTTASASSSTTTPSSAAPHGPPAAASPRAGRRGDGDDGAHHHGSNPDAGALLQVPSADASGDHGNPRNGGACDDPRGSSPSLSSGSFRQEPGTSPTSARRRHRRQGEESCELTVVSLTGESWHFEASSAEERAAWVTAIEGQIFASLQSYGSGDDARTTPSPEELQRRQRTIEEIRAVPGNERCVDCGLPNPSWASLNLGALMCMSCCGAHRALGAHVSRVRSLQLDRWPPELAAVLRAMGNRLANSVWEGGLHRRDHDHHDDDDEAMAQMMIDASNAATANGTTANAQTKATPGRPATVEAADMAAVATGGSHVAGRSDVVASGAAENGEEPEMVAGTGGRGAGAPTDNPHATTAVGDVTGGARTKPSGDSSREERERWIWDKYCERRFVCPLPASWRGAAPAEMLAHAVATGNVRAVALLLAHSQRQQVSEACAGSRDGGPGGEPILHLACARGDVVTTQLLIWYGADVSRRDARGRTALCVARDSPHGALCAHVLLAHGCL